MAEIPSEVRSAETSDLPSGESRRLRRRIRNALSNRTLTTAQRKKKIQERPVATTEVVKVIMRSLLPKFLRNFDSCSMGLVTQIQDLDKSSKSIGLRIIASIGSAEARKILDVIKLQRAQGGCPGTIRRRRTWQAAKSYGEPQAGTDP